MRQGTNRGGGSSEGQGDRGPGATRDAARAPEGAGRDDVRVRRWSLRKVACRHTPGDGPRGLDRSPRVSPRTLGRTFQHGTVKTGSLR